MWQASAGGSGYSGREEPAADAAAAAAAADVNGGPGVEHNSLELLHASELYPKPAMKVTIWLLISRPLPQLYVTIRLLLTPHLPACVIVKCGLSLEYDKQKSIKQIL